MSIQQFCLRWNNHQPNFISVFTTLLNTESLVDVTLAAEGKHLQAHKVVLSACSVYFQTLFTENPSRHPIVILKDVKYSDLRIMVDFMYYGEVNVSQEQLPQVLETAKMLKIKGLTEMPESTSLTRSQGAVAEFVQQSDGSDQQRHTSSPSNSPNMNKRRKIRRPSTSINMSNSTEELRHPESVQQQPLELGRSDSITLVSTQRKRTQDYHDARTAEAGQQTEEAQNNIHADNPLLMETNPPGLQGGQWSMMEHPYPRYTNACVGAAGLQQDSLGYISNVMSSHMGVDMNEYNQSVNVAGPSPGPSGLPDSQPQQEQQQPQKRRRTSNPQSEENFQRALEAVRFGGIGFCKAARMFGVNNRTLWLEYKKKGYPNSRPSIKSRIKREHTTPPPEHKEETQPAEQQMALLCPSHPVPVVGFIDSRPVDFPLQNAPPQSPQSLRKSRQLTRQVPVRDDSEVDISIFKRHSSHELPSTSHSSLDLSKGSKNKSPTLVKQDRVAGTSHLPLQKHSSHPPMSQSKMRRVRIQDSEHRTIQIHTVSSRDLTNQPKPSESSETPARASHTPAMRSGPPLSCNFCWNTIDECGRILRRKTQYHCPECRTNLCIVPCFHEYHENYESGSQDSFSV